MDIRPTCAALLIAGLAVAGCSSQPVAPPAAVAAVQAEPAPQAQPVSTQPTEPKIATSPTCGRVEGYQPADLDHLTAFCRQWVPADLKVPGASAMGSVLSIQLPRALADSLRADTLTTEQLVKGWMGKWKAISGSEAVTVRVNWMDVEIASGKTTVFSGDEVTIR